MIDERYLVPISPPYSPRMSDAPAKKYDYKLHRKPQQPPAPTVGGHESNRNYSQILSLPSLGTNGNSFYPLDQSRSLGIEGEHEGLDQSGGSTYSKKVTSGFQSNSAGEVQHAACAGSVPISPTDQLTPRSSHASVKDQEDHDEIDDTGNGDQDEHGEMVKMTAAELRAHKRKMKRFRLTHNQTRFLVSEFARQAHPDAAHRERLAREIPGLTARQVQVWFQNRRAKLKRLTTDDRDRMMRSRALPADFDTTQALHAHFGAHPPVMNTPGSGYVQYGEPSRALTLDTLRRVSEYESYGQHYAHTAGVSPALGGFAFTPPQSASDHLSPGPAASSMAPYMLQQQHVQYEGSRRPPTGLPTSNYPAFTEQPQMQRNPLLHDRLSRTASESVPFPLRTSLSYSNMDPTSTQMRHFPERASSLSDHSYQPQRSRVHNIESPGATGVTAYGLGFSYTSSPSYQAEDPQQPLTISESIQHTTTAGQLRRTTLPTSAFSSPSHVPQYQPYATSQYPSQSFSGAYSQHDQVTEPPQPTAHEYHQPQPQYLSIQNPSQYNSSNTQATTDHGHEHHGGSLAE